MVLLRLKNNFPFCQVNEYLSSQSEQKMMTREEVALGFIRVANEAMCRPIRALTQVTSL